MPEEPLHSGWIANLTSEAINDQRLGHAAFRVLAALATYASSDGGWCWPSQATLGKRLGLSRQTVSVHIAELEELGYLQSKRRLDDRTGAETSKMYRVILDTPRRVTLLGGQSDSKGTPQSDSAQTIPSLNDPIEHDQEGVGAGIRAAARDRLVALSEQLVGSRLSSSDLDDIDGWLTAGATVEDVDAAYDATCEAGPKVPWPFFRRVLGARLSKGAMDRARESNVKREPVMTVELIEAMIAEEQ